MTRFLIVDDHELLRRGLRSILTEAFPGVVIGEATDGRQALKAIEERDWDLVLLDINMPGRSGIDVLQDLKQQRPQLPVLVLSAFPERDYAIRALKLGAAGYLSKQGAEAELVAAIRKALAGGRYVTPLLAEILAAAAAGETTALPHETLSNRELQVLRLVALGKTLKEIASELALSEKTIGTYRMRLSQKLNLGTNVELARYALQHRLVE
jgi:two-component system, NarL family, invasion response regulator UvrY